MIQRWKRWLWEEFLPLRARESAYAEIEKWKKKCDELEQRLEVETAYASGLEQAIRYQRGRITITGGDR